MEKKWKGKNKVYTREKLLSFIWGQEFNRDIRTVDVHIRRLRMKTEKNRDFLIVFKLTPGFSNAII